MAPQPSKWEASAVDSRITASRSKEAPGQQRIIAEELYRLRWSAEQLTARCRNDPAKLAIAARLRKETTLTLKEISQRICVGSVNTAETNLHRANKHPYRSNPSSLPGQKEFVGRARKIAADIPSALRLVRRQYLSAYVGNCFEKRFKLVEDRIRIGLLHQFGIQI